MFCCAPSTSRPDRVPVVVVNVSPEPDVMVTSSDTVIVPSTFVIVMVTIERSNPPVLFSTAILKKSVVLSPGVRPVISVLD